MSEAHINSKREPKPGYLAHLPIACIPGLLVASFSLNTQTPKTPKVCAQSLPKKTAPQSQKQCPKPRPKCAQNRAQNVPKTKKLPKTVPKKLPKTVPKTVPKTSCLLKLSILLCLGRDTLPCPKPCWCPKPCPKPCPK